MSNAFFVHRARLRQDGVLPKVFDGKHAEPRLMLALSQPIERELECDSAIASQTGRN